MIDLPNQVRKTFNAEYARRRREALSRGQRVADYAVALDRYRLALDLKAKGRTPWATDDDALIAWAVGVANH